jgi:amino acid adenylation domain-containing protein
MKQFLQDWVTRQANHRPDAACIVFRDERITYAQLEAASNRLAHLLCDRGCEQGDRVCILMPKCPEAIVSMIGVLKAGCAYVPIDAASPAARISRILDTCKNRSVLAAGPVVHLLNELIADEQRRTQISIGWLDVAKPNGAHFDPVFSRIDLDHAPAEFKRQGSSHEAAHILFTSGSTGIPKGVVITHANVSAFVDWGLKHFDIDHTDRLSGCTPFHFDLSTFDIFGTMAAGAQLHLVPPEDMLPAKLASFIRESELTQWFSVPSILTYMTKFSAVKENDFPTLRRVLWCGEVLPTPTLIHWVQRLPHVRFTNLYGPTEATIASSYFDVPECPQDPRTPIPIGQPCDGEELLVLNDKLEPTKDDEIGDLYIAGAGLSPGYWGDPDKTAAAFIPDPRSGKSGGRLYRTGDLARRDKAGLFHFIGRSDTQIKSRGYRIELGEIETALNSLEKLKECAVIAIQTESFGGWMICCAYSEVYAGELNLESLRKDLAHLIPNYMLPVRWMSYEALPKNANGKIDRPLLKSRFLEKESAGAEKHAEAPADRVGSDRVAKNGANTAATASHV